MTLLQELDAALHRVALTDRSGLGRIRGSGRDTLDLLHRLTTADLKPLRAGAGLPAVLTSPKGRIVARIFVHPQEGGDILLVGGNGVGPRVATHLRRFILREDVTLADETATTRMLALVGPLASRAAGTAGLSLPSRFGSTEATLEGFPVIVLGHDGSSPDGISVVFPPEAERAIRELLLRTVQGAGGSEAGTEAIEAWRVLRGLPEEGAELTEEHNPLEAGLWEAVSFTKGCYVGQEVVARLNTYDKVARSLAGLRFPPGTPPPSPGAIVTWEGRAVGTVTSSVVPPGWESPVALAYLKRDVPENAVTLLVGSGEATVTATRAPLPFVPD